MQKINTVIVLDTSGSMSSILEESQQELNSFIDQQIEDGVASSLTVYTFNSTVNKLAEYSDIIEFQPLSMTCGGLTALNDAVGTAIAEAPKDGNNLFLIMTDGGENSSSEYRDSSKVRELVKEMESLGSEFKFFGAGVDAWSVGQDFNMKKDAYVNVEKSYEGMRSRGVFMDQAVKSFVASKT